MNDSVCAVIILRITFKLTRHSIKQLSKSFPCSVFALHLEIYTWSDIHILQLLAFLLMYDFQVRSIYLALALESCVLVHAAALFFTVIPSCYIIYVHFMYSNAFLKFMVAIEATPFSFLPSVPFSIPSSCYLYQVEDESFLRGDRYKRVDSCCVTTTGTVR